MNATARRSGLAWWLGVLLLAGGTTIAACGDDDGEAVSGDPSPQENEFDAERARDVVRRVADFQLEHPYRRDPRHWSMAALYDGLIDSSLATGDPKYLASVVRTGMRVQWILGSRTYHADGHAAGHPWLRIYMMSPERDPELLEPFVEQFNEIVENPILHDVTFGEPPPEGTRVTDRYSWADALYMSPPTVTLLAEATGDTKYLRWLDGEYRFAYDALYDQEEHLFYRDATYMSLRTPSGAKVFWIRGNAWAYAGLVYMLEAMPSDWEVRPFYENLYRELSAKLLEVQQPDGFWYPSLLDPQHVPTGETSGTAFFVASMAWGIVNGLLDAPTYRPAVLRGYDALLTRVEDDGRVVGVQPFGEAPVPFPADARAAYGTGALLRATYLLLRLTGNTPELDPPSLLQEAVELVPDAPDLTTVCEDCIDVDDEQGPGSDEGSDPGLRTRE
jgi:unsaturated rhamnogalacturonyl hydrolase